MRYWTAVAAAALLAAPALAQGRGDYFNVESPQIHPIEIATVGDQDFLLVCNTPDNSVEIYATDDANSFLARVPTGLEPVSVRWIPELGRFYSANFLGDSLTVVSLGPGAGGVPEIQVEGTFRVGDEPLDVTYYQLSPPGGPEPVDTLFVTFMNLDGVGWLTARNLQPVAPGTELFEAAIELLADGDCDGVPETTIRQALKAPRTLFVRSGQLVTLGTRVDLNPPFDMAANCRDPQTILTGDLSTSLAVGGLGSTNFNMALASNGDVFVVGGDAQNQLDDEPVVAAAPTGFVQSTFYMVRDICGTPVVKARDVNLEIKALQQPNQTAKDALVAQPVTGPVGFGKALAQLTDVVPFEQNGEVVKVFFTAFGSDRLGIIVPDFADDPINWTIRRRNIAAQQHPVAGPRGLALKARPGDSRPRLYVANRLDNSVTVFDPVAESQVGAFKLQRDPTAPWIRAGQKFLYSAKLSGTGFVSCASCHVDGRTDDLPWDLGTPAKPAAMIPPTLVDGDAVNQLTEFPADKNDMITQSLQGLLNWEVEPGTMELATNAPYHWRGDKEDFLAFNVAFEDLMLGSQLGPDEMEAYEEFVNSIHYGPNPKQPRNRKYSGDFGDPGTFVFDPGGDGSSGALRGLKIFHTVRSLQQSSCVRCHQLPEGSNNRITVNLGQPTESAAMRGLFQKEGKRDENGYSDPTQTAYTGFFGMLHTGFTAQLACTDPLFVHLLNPIATINSFINLAFEATICPGQGPFCPDGQDLSQYVHELDWGTGPMVGYPLTVFPGSSADDGQDDPCDPARTDPDGLVDCMEDQSRLANSGVAARGRLAGAERGFWYDPRSLLYVEEPPGVVVDRATLLAQVTDAGDYLTFTATPLGSERRVAAPDGQPQDPTPGPAPSELLLLPIAPNTANPDIPTQTRLWADLNNAAQESIFVHTLRIYQEVLVQKAPQFGLPEVRHDAPRRFRVAGRDIRPGAELHLFTFDWPDNQPLPPPGLLPTIDPAGPLTQVPTRRSVFPLYPTDDTLADGRRIWETAVELDTLAYTMLMLGWEDGPGVADIYNDVWVEGVGFQFPDPPDAATLALFDPVGYNLHYVRVVNADGSQADAAWQPITLQ